MSAVFGNSPPAAKSTAPGNASRHELRAILDRQCLEMEELRGRLQAQKLAAKAVAPNLCNATLMEFQGKFCLPR